MSRSYDEPPRDGDALRERPAPRDLDPELAPVAEALRRLPVVRPGAPARVVAAALGHGRGGAGETPARWRPSVGLTATAAAALIAAVGLLLAGRGQRAGDDSGAGQLASGVGALPSTPAVPPVVVRQTASVPVSAAAFAGAGLAEDAPVLVPFVLRRPDARRVAVVGDFNGWSPAANALARETNGVWTATLPVTPGRHAYGFVVDDTLWVRDPRADTERDVDYGRDHSVIVVGRP